MTVAFTGQSRANGSAVDVLNCVIHPRAGGGRFPGTVDGPCCWSVPTATRRAVTSTVGNGIAFRDGRTESGVSAGDAGLALDCATLPKAAICVRALCGGLWGTCHGRNHGFRLCSRHRKRRQKRASVNCHPSVGTGSTDFLGSVLAPPFLQRNNFSRY